MITASFILNCCAANVPVTTIESAGEWIQAVENLPERNRNRGCRGGPARCRRELLLFDVNDYLLVFDHLSIEQGYLLDYIYKSDSVGGMPVLYAYPDGKAPLRSYDEFIAAHGSSYQGSFEKIEHSDDYLAHVMIDDTPEGYFQFVALKIMDDLFYLNWHAYYNDTTIITSADEARKAYSEAEGGGDRSDLRAGTRLQSKINGLDYTPTVVMDDDHAIVRLITFSDRGGFRELTVTIQRTFPHEIVKWKKRLKIFTFTGVIY